MIPAPVTADSLPNGSHAGLSFRWVELESPDYLTYISRLRRIGCPETTVRDLITADLHAAYDAKRVAVLAGEPRKFWQHGFGSMEIPEVKAVNTAEAEVLARLLGAPDASVMAAASPGASPDTFKLGPGLSLKGSAIQSWWEDYTAQRQAILAGTEDRELTDQEQASLATLEQAKETNLNGRLTPKEREEFEMRNSPSAEIRRDSAGKSVGFVVTEREFRKLAGLRQDYDRYVEELEKAGGGNLEEAWQVLQGQVTGVLGSERAALLHNAEDPRFQQVWRQALAEN
jgi:hypothetical protein